MFGKILSYILIIFGLVVLYASTSRTAMQYISDKRDTDTWWGSYQGKHGDLVGMSYLEFVKKFNRPPDLSPLSRPVYSGTKNIELYLHGDSYCRKLTDTVFAAICSYHFMDRIRGYKYHLDTTKRNILIIETSERALRDYFNCQQMFIDVYDSTKKKNVTAINSTLQEHAHYGSFTPGIHLGDVFNKYINQNLQFNLFNYNFIRPLFECKAALTYYFFNRASGDVVIADSGNFLFLKETVTATDIGSSYIHITTDNITYLVNSLNIIYDHYKKEGFKEVYLSVIPNAATIMQPARYNNLIPLLQNDPRLKIKIIDVYSMVKNFKGQLLVPNDTHWNRNGTRKWIELVNEKLIKEASEK